MALSSDCGHSEETVEEVRPATATSSYSAFNVDVHMVTTCSSVHRNWAGTQWSSRT